MQTNLKGAKDSLRTVDEQKMALAFELAAAQKQIHAQAVEIVRLRKLVYEHQVPRATSAPSSSSAHRPREPLPPGPLEPEVKKKKLAAEAAGEENEAPVPSPRPSSCWDRVTSASRSSSDQA